MNMILVSFHYLYVKIRTISNSFTNHFQVMGNFSNQYRLSIFAYKYEMAFQIVLRPICGLVLSLMSFHFSDFEIILNLIIVF